MDNSNSDNSKLLLNSKKLAFHQKYNFQQRNLKLQKQDAKWVTIFPKDFDLVWRIRGEIM